MTTLLRVFLIPAVIYCFYEGIHQPENLRWFWWLISLLILGICELTDFLDGYFARSFQQVSELGKLLDPLCDSLMRFSVFLAMSQFDMIPGWAVYVFFYRDLTVAYLRILAMSKGVVFGARMSGKIKAVAQGIGIFSIIAWYFFNSLGIDILFGVCDVQSFAVFIMMIVCGVTIWSGVDYAYKIFSMPMSENKKSEK